MVLDTSMSLLPCRSTRRLSSVSTKHVQSGMGRNIAGSGRDCADSIIQFLIMDCQAYNWEGQIAKRSRTCYEMYSGVYVMLLSHVVNLPIAVLRDCSNFNVATLCKLRK